jgi:hypothetical protein
LKLPDDIDNDGIMVPGEVWGLECPWPLAVVLQASSPWKRSATVSMLVLPGIHNNPGSWKWYVDAEKCLTFWSMNKKKWTSCGGRCIAVCPWNKPIVSYYNMFRWAAIHSPTVIKKMLVWSD